MWYIVAGRAGRLTVANNYTLDERKPISTIEARGLKEAHKKRIEWEKENAPAGLDSEQGAQTKPTAIE